jgi:hypothetical protein
MRALVAAALGTLLLATTGASAGRGLRAPSAVKL